LDKIKKRDFLKTASAGTAAAVGAPYVKARSPIK
jgi:hypothetical protein